jgi:crotonobetainyl-CoA:carnitine CoA-transferase CaiB-like acyl-CoA transferase
VEDQLKEQQPSRLASPPLDGLRVIDASTVYAGPLAAMFLGDFGAEVLKIEHPLGDPARTHGFRKKGQGLWWKVISRNKLAITLKLSSPEGQNVMKRLIAENDVLVENFRPGVLERWNLGPEELHRVNPRLVMLRVTGFGQFGPYARRRAFGTLAEAMTGFAHLTGEANGPPTLPPFGLADGVAGMAGALAVMLALHKREQSGKGQVIDLALIDPLLTLLGPHPTVYDQLGIVQTRMGNRSSNNAPRNTYCTRDGTWVAISASTTSVAERVMRVVGHPEVIDEPWFASAGERVKHADLLDGYVTSWIGARDFDEVMRTFDEAGAALAPIYDISQVMSDPQFRARESITTVEDEDLGPLAMQNLIFRLSASPGSIRFAGRKLGQDNEPIFLDRLGLSREEYEAMREDGVI